jgi:hypothetical protein
VFFLFFLFVVGAGFPPAPFLIHRFHLSNILFINQSHTFVISCAKQFAAQKIGATIA